MLEYIQCLLEEIAWYGLSGIDPQSSDTLCNYAWGYVVDPFEDW